MASIIKYKLELFGGPKDMAIRYYNSLSIALRVANSYMTRNRDYPEQIGYEIHEVYNDHTTRLTVCKLS